MKTAVALAVSFSDSRRARYFVLIALRRLFCVRYFGCASGVFVFIGDDFNYNVDFSLFFMFYLNQSIVFDLMIRH